MLTTGLAQSAQEIVVFLIIWHLTHLPVSEVGSLQTGLRVTQPEGAGTMSLVGS